MRQHDGTSVSYINQSARSLSLALIALGCFHDMALAETLSCQDRKELAETIMSARQEGVPKVSLLNIQERSDASLKAIMAPLISEAYQQPIDHEIPDFTTKAFGELIFNRCRNAGRK